MPTQSSKAEAIPSKLRAGFSSSSPRGASISLSSTREPDPARKRAAIFARRSDARGRVTARYCLGPHCHPAALGSPCPRNAPPPPRPPPLAEPMPNRRGKGEGGAPTARARRKQRDGSLEVGIGRPRRRPRSGPDFEIGLKSKPKGLIEGGGGRPQRPPFGPTLEDHSSVVRPRCWLLSPASPSTWGSVFLPEHPTIA